MMRFCDTNLTIIFTFAVMKTLLQIPFGSSDNKQHIASVNWPDQFPYCPDVTFRIWHTDTAIHLHFEVDEKTTKAEQIIPGKDVYMDSSVELFIKPTEDNPYYYNLEWNAAGCLCMHCRTGREHFIEAPAEVLAMVESNPSLGREAFAEVHTSPWSLDVKVPVQAFFKHDIKSLKGLKMTANLYKCGDGLSTPHYISWNKVETPNPDHHRPEFFAPIEFV